MRAILTLTFVIAFTWPASGAGQPAQQSEQPLTADQIARAIGSDADARTVMTMFLQQAFESGNRPRTEYLLRSQIRDEWLPKSDGVTVVQLSGAEAATRLTACGDYIVISAQKQTDGVVYLTRRPKCRASSSRSGFAVRDGRWRLVSSGIGSGWVGGPPAECLRCVAR